MKKKLPAFNSLFLDGVCRRLQARGKSLKHRGELAWDTKQPDDFEWITFYFTPVIGHYVIVQLCEDQRASIYLRQSRGKRRGKVLLRIEDIFLFDNSVAIVEAIEFTISTAATMCSSAEPEIDKLALGRIHAAWSKLQAHFRSGRA